MILVDHNERRNKCASPSCRKPLRDSNGDLIKPYGVLTPFGARYCVACARRANLASGEDPGPFVIVE